MADGAVAVERIKALALASGPLTTAAMLAEGGPVLTLLVLATQLKREAHEVRQFAAHLRMRSDAPDTPNWCSPWWTRPRPPAWPLTQLRTLRQLHWAGETARVSNVRVTAGVRMRLRTRRNMSPVVIGMLVWLGVIVVLALLAYLRHRFEKKHAQRLRYQRQAFCPDGNGGDRTNYHYPLPVLEHDYEASLEASRARRGK